MTSTDQSWVFLGPEWVVQAQRWSPIVSIWNFLQPQVESVTSSRAGTLVPTQEQKNVYQRLEDQTSFLWWDQICPNQLMGLNQSTCLRTSTSWDSRLVISVCRTESSTVATTRCCARKHICSSWWESSKVCVRSLKCWHILRIWTTEEKNDDVSPDDVYHRPVTCEQHYLPYQTETGGLMCPYNHSWLVNYDWKDTVSPTNAF